MENMTIPGLLFGKGKGEVLRLITDKGRISMTLPRLREEVARFWGALRARGVGKGSSVVVLAGPGTDTLVADLAIMACGAMSIVVPATGFMKKVEEFAKAFRCTLIINAHVEGWTVGGRKAWVPRSLLGSAVPFETIMKEGKGEPRELEASLESLDPHSPAALLFTSGSENATTPFVLTHANLLRSPLHLRQSLQLRRGEKVLLLDQMHGLSVGIRSREPLYLCLASGATLVASEKMTDPRIVLWERPSVIISTPRALTIMRMQIWKLLKGVKMAPRVQQLLNAQVALETARQKGADLIHGMARNAAHASLSLFLDLVRRIGVGNKLRHLLVTDAPLPHREKLFFRSFGFRPRSAYRLTEAGGTVALEPPNNPSDQPWMEILPGLEMDVWEKTLFLGGDGMADPSLQLLPIRQLHYQGPWTITDDVILLNEGDESKLLIQGRLSEYVEVEGQQIFLPEIERALESHPLVERAVAVLRDRPAVAFLIYPYLPVLAKVAQSRGLSVQNLRAPWFKSTYDMILLQTLNKLNPPLPYAGHYLLSRDLSPSVGELDLAGKLRRSVVLQKHREALDGVYWAWENQQ